jgi:phosphohistidine phosphatase SixA
MHRMGTWLAALALASVVAGPSVVAGQGAPAAQGTTHDSTSTTLNPLIPRLSDVPGLADPTFVANLKKGGYIIFFRHASTDWSQTDTAGEDFADRARQRNLSELGKAEAASIGSSIRALAIPIDTVFASPMLRCRDTADIAFGRSLPMLDLFRKGAEYRERRIRLLSMAPTSGANRVLVGHQDQIVPIIPGLHRDELREAEALVIQPLGDRKFAVVAQVTVGDWARLAAAYPAEKAAPEKKTPEPAKTLK